MKVNNKVVFSNLFWRFAERIGAKGVGLLVSIILARILSPEDYGIVAIISVFMVVFNVFVDSGLGNALIQKKDADEDDFTTVFYFNIVWCIILYGSLFLIAPFISHFYNDLQLISLIRIAGLTLVFSGVKNIQQAYISRSLQFKKFFIATLAGTVLSGVIGVRLAYHGAGAWALVIQSLSNTAIDTVVLWVTVKWRPKGRFSLQRLKKLFSYGWKFLASSLLDTIYNNLRTLVIGKKYRTEDLAYYNKAKGWPDLIIANINISINSVLLPTMSLEQDNKVRLKNMTRRAITISTYVITPMLLGLFCVAPLLVELVLTEKWLPIVPYMRIFCITNIFYPIHTANLNAIKAMGRSDLFLKLEIIKKIMGMIVLLATMWFGPLVMAYSLLVSDFLAQVINTWPNKKLLDYNYYEQMKDIIPNLITALIMVGVVSCVKIFWRSPFIVIVLQVIAGVLCYIGVSVVTKNESFFYLWRIVKPMVLRNKK